MGVGEGGFRMTNAITRAVNLSTLTEHEISLAGAYAQSAVQDRLIATDFETAMSDGLTD